MVKKVAPGVVKVFTTTRAHNTAYNGPTGMPDHMDDMFRRFFGDGVVDDGHGPYLGARVVLDPGGLGQGAGAVWSDDCLQELELA